MPQFDYFRLSGTDGFVLDCQCDLLTGLDTRLVVPLLPLRAAPIPATRLNPVFEIEGAPHSMVTQFASAVTLAELGPRAGSLADERYRIIGALDFLLTGV